MAGDGRPLGDGYGTTAEGDRTRARFVQSATRPIARPMPPRAARRRAAGPSLIQSSSVMAVGTIASRATGMLRNIVVIAAIGAQELGNAYNVANTLPNTVYDLAVGGILSSVIVPLLVTAARRDVDRGERYTQRMFTLVTLALLGITLLATLGAGEIGTLYGCGNNACVPAHNPDAAMYHHVLVLFSYFFIPQIFFYGMSAIIGAVLNARGHFAAPMWTPVVNNVVVITVMVFFMVVAGVFTGSVPHVDTITPFEIDLLGIGTTLGIVAQTVALVPAMRQVGFRWRPRFDFRRVEVAEIGSMGGWMFGYVVTTQVAFFVTVWVSDKVTTEAGHGYTAYAAAWVLFQMPYAVIAVSVITALLPRMSANAAARRWDLLRGDFSTGVRLGAVFVAPAALVLAAIGPPLAELLYGWGANGEAGGRYIGLVFSVFALGLVPYMLFQLVLRVFYSLHDSRTPALIGVATMAINIVVNLIALAVVSSTYLVASLGIGFGIANVLGAVVSWRILSRRMGGLGGRQIGASLSRIHTAAIPAGLVTLGVAVLVTGTGPYGKVTAVLAVILGGGAGLLVYLGIARALHIPEVTDLVTMARRRLGR